MSTALSSVLRGSLLCSVAAILACGKKEASTPATGATPPPVASAAVISVTHDRPLTPVQREKTVELGRDFAEKITKGNFTALGADLPVSHLLDTALSGVDLTKAPRWRDLRADILTRHGKEPGVLFASLDGARARFLRLRDTPHGPAALIRADHEAGTVSYFDVHPRFDEAGLVHIGDFYNHATGLSLTDVYRSLFLTLAGESDESLAASLFGVEKVSPALLRRFDGAIRSKNAAELQALWPTLPLRLQTDRLFMMARLQVLMAEPTSATYAKALAETRVAFASDPVADLLAIDALMLEKDVPRFDECIRRVTERLGGPDAYLTLCRGLVRLHAGTAEEARPFIEQAVQEEPDFALAAFAKLRLLARQKAWAEACEWLTQMADRFKLRPEAVRASTDESLAALAATPEFARWVASQPGAPPK